MYKKIKTELNKKPKNKIEKLFKKELDYFKFEDIRNFVTEILRLAPGYFFSSPSSSSGKYHPQYENSPGGLVVHTRAVAYMVTQLYDLQMYGFKSREKDLILAAAILHDIKKNGNNSHCQYTVFDHPVIAANFIREFSNCDIISAEDIEYIAGLIETHMGQWNVKSKNSKCPPLPLPKTTAQQFLHLCDFIVSRKDVNLSSYLFDPEASTVTTEDVRHTLITFGKYKGLTYQEVFESDPGYLDWLYVTNMQKNKNGEKTYLSMDVINGIHRMLYVENPDIA